MYFGTNFSNLFFQKINKKNLNINNFKNKK